MIALACVAAWAACSVPFGVVIGRALANAERRGNRCYRDD